MQIFITMLNKIIKKTVYLFLAIAFWLVVWEAASFIISDNLKLFLPSPVLVIKALIRLARTGNYWFTVSVTVLRIFTGFICGTLSGIALGLLTSHNKVFDIIVSPAMRVIRAVPVVSFIILAYLFINVNYLPVFICFLMVMPLIWQTVHDKITGFDTNLSDMCKVFKIKGFKKLFYVKLRTISGDIVTAMINGIGLAWKSGIAAEVLCTPIVSLGRSIYRSKGNINYDEVYALTITVVILSIIIEYFIKYSYRKKLAKRLEKNNDRV